MTKQQKLEEIRLAGECCPLCVCPPDCDQPGIHCGRIKNGKPGCECHTKPSPQMDWREEYEIENVHFLIYDKASGSHWLDHDRLKSFISTVEARARKEVAESILEEMDEMESDSQFLVTSVEMRTIINKYINE